MTDSVEIIEINNGNVIELMVAEIDCVQSIKIFCYCSASGWTGKELIVSTLHFTLDGEKL